MTPPATPAGWYPDPADPQRLRYHDGEQWTEHRHTPTPTRMSNEDRVDKLDAFLANELRRFPTMRVEARTPYQVNIVAGSNPNHVVHALFTLFSCGLWAVVWLVAYATQKERRSMMAVDPYGNITWA